MMEFFRQLRATSVVCGVLLLVLQGFCSGDAARTRAMSQNAPEGTARGLPGHTTLGTLSMRGLLQELREKDTALLEAARGGDLAEVQGLLAKGADIDARDDSGQTPLERASIEGHVDVVTELLAAGAQLESRDDRGETPLIEAAFYGRLEVVRLLLDAGADVNAAGKNERTALSLAAGRGHVDVLEVLIAAGADVDAVSDNGWTALIWAADGGHLRMVKDLISAGAQLDAQNTWGWTALMWAARNGDLPIVKALVNGGADLSLTSTRKYFWLITYPRGSSALHVAARGDLEAVVEFLVDSGASTTITDGNGNTPKDVARSDLVRDLLG